jgi:hypothetical protein
MRSHISTIKVLHTNILTLVKEKNLVSRVMRDTCDKQENRMAEEILS